jgi:hypothetical protein
VAADQTAELTYTYSDVEVADDGATSAAAAD